jgi:hypothetical protein
MLNLFGLSLPVYVIVIVSPSVASDRSKYLVCVVNVEGVYVSDTVSPHPYVTTVGVAVGVGVGVAVAVGVDVAVAVGVGVPLLVGVGVAVGVLVTVGVGVATAPGKPVIEIHCVVPEQLPPSTLTNKLTTLSGIPVIVFGNPDTACDVTKLEQPLPQDAPVQPDIDTVCPVIPLPIVPKSTEALNAISYKYLFYFFN